MRLENFNLTLKSHIDDKKSIVAFLFISNECIYSKKTVTLDLMYQSM